MGDRGRALEAMGRLIGPDFWRDRPVLLTGHTGFVGAWTALWLERLGARVLGMALPPETEPNLYRCLSPWPRLQDRVVDLRDPEAVRRTVVEARPSIVLHLAAQALVRRAYREPVETLATNVLGTAHLLDALKEVDSLRAVVVVTSDKVYLNHERGLPFGEGDPLGGHDPYSASKAAQEHVAQAFARSFLADRGVAVATARAGNLIGGGDWGSDRLVPDLWRAAQAGRAAALRHPASIRPWLHVLDAVAGYLGLAQRLADAAPGTLPPALNLGPAGDGRVAVGELSTRFLDALGASTGWTPDPGEHPPEKRTLALESHLARATLAWHPRLDSDRALQWTADWYATFDRGEDVRTLSTDQLTRYVAELD